MLGVDFLAIEIRNQTPPKPVKRSTQVPRRGYPGTEKSWRITTRVALHTTQVAPWTTRVVFRFSKKSTWVAPQTTWVNKKPKIEFTRVLSIRPEEKLFTWVETFFDFYLPR